MASEVKKEIQLEIAHVLFIDIVGYSKLLIDEQSEALQELNQIVRNTEAARTADLDQDLHEPGAERISTAILCRHPGRQSA